MKHFLLTYALAPDYLDRRPEFRGAHLALAREAAKRGDLLLGGAVTDLAGGPPDGAMLLFVGEDSGAAEEFAMRDPYVANGLVLEWRVREWLTVVGEGAVNPVPA